ncbi:MAG: hypothetical protein ABSA76_06335 [Bacteroidales bacterium]
MKKKDQKNEEDREHIDSNEGYSQMLELYTMLPPSPFKKKRKKSSINQKKSAKR